VRELRLSEKETEIVKSALGAEIHTWDRAVVQDHGASRPEAREQAIEHVQIARDVLRRLEK
jgi:hypothetical protein